MSDLLITGSNAVRNSQLALNVVSNNIANVNTEGYVKQSVNYAETPSAVVGALSIGTGAIADGISRAYDSLIENAVRTTESDLVSKESMIEYTNKLIDFLGDEKASLTPALSNFFDSIRSLATDASSAVQRDQLLASGNSLANRFNEISGQLNAFERDSAADLDLKINQVNELTNELALVNRKLIRVQDISKQPPELLNLRDRLLKDLSGYVRTAVSEKENGSFEVSIQSVGVVLVDKNGCAPLSLRPSASDVNKLELFQASPSGELRVNRPGGSIDGIIDFRERILVPVVEGLEEIANTFMERVNSVHASGVDLLGNSGKKLFSADPVIEVGYPDPSGRLVVEIGGALNSDYLNQSYEIEFDGEKGAWKTLDANGNAVLSPANAQTINLDGMKLAISGNAKGGDKISIVSQTDTASSIRLVIDDYRQIAAAGSHNLVAKNSNVGNSVVSLTVDKGKTKAAIRDISEALVNNLGVNSAKVIENNSSVAAFAVGAGSRDTVLKLHATPGEGSELQIFTRGGVHLFGTELGEAEFERLASEDNSFYEDVTYKTRYLNGGITEIRVDIKDLSTTNGDLVINGEVISQGFPVPSAIDLVDLVNASSDLTDVVALIENEQTLVLRNAEGKESNPIELGAEEGILGKLQGVQTPTRYLDLGWRAGVFGKTSFSEGEDGNRYLREEAKISGNSIPGFLNEGAEAQEFISAGALSLNGYAMGALNLGAGEALTPDAVREWLLTNIEENALPLTADLVASTTVSSEDLSTTRGGLEINGFDIGREEPFTSLGELRDTINNSSGLTGVSAILQADGSLRVQNADFENRDRAITFGQATSSIPDVIGVKNPALEISYSRIAGNTIDQEVSLTVGPSGGFSDLTKLGFSGSIELNGVTKEDLLVIATGNDGTSSKISAEYSEKKEAGFDLIDRDLTVEFLSEDKYRFIDNLSGTVLTERTFETEGKIEFQGLVLKFSGKPQKGDMFSIAPQNAGQGDTATLIQLSNLEKAEIFENSKSLQDGYLSVLSKVGALSSQADVAREAYEVLRDQAVERREGLSGVNLDEEASSLIRFQQSYQASARLVRTANELFDTILRI